MQNAYLKSKLSIINLYYLKTQYALNIYILYSCYDIWSFLHSFLTFKNFSHVCKHKITITMSTSWVKLFFQSTCTHTHNVFFSQDFTYRVIRTKIIIWFLSACCLYIYLYTLLRKFIRGLRQCNLTHFHGNNYILPNS